MPVPADTYVVIVSNAVLTTRLRANVVVTFRPAELSGASYLVLQTGGASGATAGTGNINQTVNVPVGGIIYYYVHATIVSCRYWHVESTNAL